ncbi:DUF861 domain-containing protein [Rhizobiales bacterium]|uniref:cupin domain-containing protein n=1 Tax=Hongsoonwoonella zoysiae TaxID=2821844 RepID=UPI0015611B47|nr:cupin domain-containing protein [Hongsoonwoonella zoysiae]NRG16372.1 DUF861 domain-containing protein [Hongsoonwoonella zoysiae]
MSDDFAAGLADIGSKSGVSEFDFAAASVGTLPMRPAPIRPQWIIEGEPVARVAPLARSVDGFANTAVWDCTAGKFHWYYGGDEAVYILQGSVEVTAPDGSRRLLRAGDTAYFPAGSWFRWHVRDNVRKVAFNHSVLPPFVRFQMKMARKLRQIGHKLFGDAQVPGRK